MVVIVHNIFLFLTHELMLKRLHNPITYTLNETNYATITQY